MNIVPTYMERKKKQISCALIIIHNEHKNYIVYIKRKKGQQFKEIEKKTYFLNA